MSSSYDLMDFAVRWCDHLDLIFLGANKDHLRNISAIRFKSKKLNVVNTLQSYGDTFDLNKWKDPILEYKDHEKYILQSFSESFKSCWC